MGVYVPPNDAPTIVRAEEALGKAAKGVDIILLGVTMVTEEFS